jgi:hypothetical protein
MSDGKDQPLRCEVTDGQLIIRVGIDTLAHAAASCERFYVHSKHSGPPYLTITDNEQFARDVARELESEEEDGSTPISDTLDDAIVAAHSEGSEAINYKDDE